MGKRQAEIQETKEYDAKKGIDLTLLSDAKLITNL